MKILLLITLCSYLYSVPFDGYTLISEVPNPNLDTYKTYLVDNDNNMINEWSHNYRPLSISYLNSDSTLITAYNSLNDDSLLNNVSAIYNKMTWDSNIIWQYELSDSICLPHHDISILPNGNILSICTEFKNQDEALNMGYDQQPDSLFGFDMLIEIQPIGNDSANIVWEWKSSEHLIQNISLNLINYGLIEDHPELLDINMPFNISSTSDWLHMNCISYNSLLDQIVLSARFSSEFYVIDHSTTIEESSSNSGGLYGKGGDILYRWGNPQNYGRGTVEDKILGAQHGVDWIPQGYLGAGNFLLFNNQHDFYGANNPNNKSAVIEIEPPLNMDGSYNIIEESPFGPEIYSWVYIQEFFSNFQSGSFRLPNGNTLITSSADGLILEINQFGEIELTYQQYNPIRAIKYSYDYLNTDVLIGDINNDQIINILDVVATINFVLSNDYNSLADLNLDGQVNVLDIVQLINIILN